MKKLIAEMFGTAVLVLFGCGSVVLAGYGAVMPLGAVPIAFAFGLTVMAMAYTIGPVSGCHINPAVTAAMMTSGRMSTSEGLKYMAAQVFGAFVGAGLLALILSGKTGGYNIAAKGLGQNMFTSVSVLSALLCEVIGTMIFTAVILGATQEKGGAGNLAGLVIGLTLVLIHLLLIPVTGTSVNPARTIAPNIYVGGQAAEQIWLFIVGPLLGGAISGFLFKAKILSSEG